MTFKAVALGAGFFCISLAILAQGVLPVASPESRETRATRAVRTDFGDVRWVWYESSPSTPLEQRGRDVYRREGCWDCHSQYVRPVAGEDQRWGPVSLVGEYAYDGPVLTRVGLEYADAWHYAHHWDPTMLVPDSIMPKFRWLYRTASVRVVEKDGAPAFADTASLRALFSFGDARIEIYPSPGGLAFAEHTGGTPVLATAGLPEPYNTLAAWRGRTLTVIVPHEDLRGLVAYLQKLGTNRGAWREVFEPRNPAATVMTIPQTVEQAARGEAIYERRCTGCHGAKGDGNGPAATFMSPRPRNFTTGVFKFRSTPSGSLPTDGDLYRTLTRGVRWTAMPAWHEIPPRDRAAVIAYIKTFSIRWKDAAREPALMIPPSPLATRELLARGKTLYRDAQCFECHGAAAKGDGPSADQLQDDAGFRIRPTDFTRGQFKGGGTISDVYRSMTTGLDGTPMPSFADSMTDAERWAISYYVLSFSAFSDPLTGRTLALDAETRARLDAPGPDAFRSAALALDPAPSAPAVARAATGDPRRLVRLFRGLLGSLILGQLLVSVLMALGAACLFVWAAAAGLLADVEPVKYQVLESEGVTHDTRS